MHRRRRGSAILALGLVASLLLPATVPASPAVAAPSGAKKVIVQLFEWNWPSVASECQSTLGPKGYGYVQVSPPQEHVRATSGGWRTSRSATGSSPARAPGPSSSRW